MYHNNLSSFKCKTCNMNFEDKQHLENHKKIHGRRSKVYEYGDPEFSKDRLRG
jgi:transposase-like protein